MKPIDKVVYSEIYGKDTQRVKWAIESTEDMKQNGQLLNIYEQDLVKNLIRKDKNKMIETILAKITNKNIASSGNENKNGQNINSFKNQ